MASPNLISNYAWTKVSACLPRDAAGAWHSPGMSGQFKVDPSMCVGLWSIWTVLTFPVNMFSGIKAKREE